MNTITKRPIGDDMRLWMAGSELVAVEFDGEKLTGRPGPGFDEVCERVRLALGLHVQLADRSLWCDAIGRGVLRVVKIGVLVDGTIEWRKATTPDGDEVDLVGVGSPLDARRKGGDGRHPFPSGVVSSAIPQIAARAARFGDVDVPAGAALWGSYVAGKIAVELPSPPDVTTLLMLQMLASQQREAA